MAVQTRTIDYTDGGTGLEGYFAWDDVVSATRPGVLVVHAWAGRSPSKKKLRVNSLHSATPPLRWTFTVKVCSAVVLRRMPS